MRYSTASRLTFSMSTQYLLFSSTFMLLCDKVKHQYRSEHNPLIFRRSCTFESITNNSLRPIYGSKLKKLRILKLIEKLDALTRECVLQICDNSCLPMAEMNNKMHASNTPFLNPSPSGTRGGCMLVPFGKL